MSEQTPNHLSDRAYFQETCTHAGIRNPAMVALTLKGDLEKARRFFQGFVEEYAAHPLPSGISEENRNPERLARAAIVHVIRTSLGAEGVFHPTEEKMAEELGAYALVFAERAEQADT
jgi:hypothetical protein